MTSLLAMCLFVSEAQASDPVLQIIEECQRQYSTRESMAQCITSARFALSEEHDRKLADELAQLSTAVERLGEQPPAQVGASPVHAVGVAWQPVPRPIVVSIHNLEAMDPNTLRIWGLNTSSARKRCGGEGASLVVITNHGVPVTNIWAPEGEPSGFREVYWDGDRDGIPDPKAVYALDLATQDDVWVSWWVGQDVRVVYIRPSGKIGVQSLPLQTLYRPTSKRDSVGGNIACDMDELVARGGHRQVPAYAMSRVW